MARLAGGFYLGFILSSVLADALGHIGMGSVDDVYRAILVNNPSFRLGLVIAFGSAWLFLLAAWSLYVLLRTVADSLALLFLLLNTVGVALQCASMLPLIAAMLLGASPDNLPGYSGEQVEGMAHLFITVYKTGFVAAQLFFSTWLFPLGYVVYKSGFLPRFLGVLLALDGVADLIWFLQGLLLPDQHAITYPGLAVSFVAEVGLALWLLIGGVKHAGASTASKSKRSYGE
nr:DUF4386 domain-containing protein [Microlunatus panaciterrae]